MKKLSIYLLILASMSFVSCDEDLTDIYAPGSQTEEIALQNYDDLNKLLNSSYANLFTREEIVFNAIFTDEASKGFANGGQGVNSEYVFFMFPSSTGPSAIWQSNYFALARINRILAKADDILANTPDTTTQKRIKRVKAEALMLRAFAHLKILSYFSTDMKDDNALAGILSNRVIPTSETPSRSTNGAFYTLIHSDLDAAITLYSSLDSAVLPSATDRTNYVGIAFAKGLKARAYSYKGDYVNAEIWADDVINTSGIVLAPRLEYKRVFWSENEAANTEVIFRNRRTPIQNNQGTNVHNGFGSLRPNASGAPWYEVSRSLFNKLNTTGSSTLTGAQLTSQPDVRLHTIVSHTSTIDNNYQNSSDFLNTDRLVLHKHGGNESGNTTWATTTQNGNNNSIKVMRISEMYLIKAEARAAAEDFIGAANAVQAIRAVRNNVAVPTPVYNSAQDAWKGILDERRIEFAFEGFRYIDLRRLASLAGVTLLDRDPMDYDGLSLPGANPNNLPLNSYKMTMPIPQSEINGNGSIQQNPGY